jgi:hypothetical protein
MHKTLNRTTRRVAIMIVALSTMLGSAAFAVAQMVPDSPPATRCCGFGCQTPCDTGSSCDPGGGSSPCSGSYPDCCYV